jgi:catechol 2,3-dioxygenase-like lactoylglutathione lyase family enzyme
VGLAPSGFRQVRLRAGSTLLKLMQIVPAPPTGSDEFKAGVRWLTYFVADINETVAALKAKGVEFISEPHGTLVAAKDPDGLLVEIVQR